MASTTSPVLQLQAAVRGRVATDASVRALYATDASNYRHVPMAVITPLDEDDLVAAVGACRAAGLAVTLRGGGTSIAGNCTGPGVVIDTSRHLRTIHWIDPGRQLAHVGPGVVLDDLNAAAAEHGLMFAPDPSTHSRCTIGGMLGNNACGAHSVAYGKTSDNVESLDVVLYDGTRLTVGAASADDLSALVARPDRIGELYRDLTALAADAAGPIRDCLLPMPRRVSGFALDLLLPEHGFDLVRALVGTEGTCVTIVAATLRLVPRPGALALVVAGFADDASAADAVPGLLPLRPQAIEGIDRELVDAYLTARPGTDIALLPPGGGWLFIEVGAATAAGAEEAARAVAARAESYRSPAAPERGGCLGTIVVTDPGAAQALWRIREDGAGLATRLPDGAAAYPGWEDAAVPPARLGDYLRQFRALRERHGLRGVSYGHFGDGCVHVRLDFDFSSVDGVRRFRRFLEEAALLVTAYGGSLSGEHGDGQARGELLATMYPPAVLEAFARFKRIFDPDGRMNPGVGVAPRPLDSDLRVDPRRTLIDVRPTFALGADAGSLADAVHRCVGVGKCRSQRGGVMCPSYRVTQEEQHSTRGRAHLLAEMLEGDVITGGWRSAEVRDALDLCLSCKGCASDCPVDVDMATYKSEFLHHHYRRRLRPVSHYSMGWLPLWARLASVAPSVVNFVTGRRLAAGALKRLGGVARDRQIPQLAASSLTRQWSAAGSASGLGKRVGAGMPGGQTVVLWPDTFTNYLEPRIGEDAVRVLQSAGASVVLPAGPVCCGLTWISTGQLGVARGVLRRSLRAVAPYVGTETMVVGLEPSCTAALRHELIELLPGDPAAAWLASHVRTFAEAIEAVAPDSWSPEVGAASISQTHCHQHATGGTAADRRLMARVGLDNRVLDAGCCGLAGNFGFESAHYDVSIAVGELVLLPAVRAAAANVEVLADGFSCRTQIEHGTGRKARHLAEVIAAALDDGAPQA